MATVNQNPDQYTSAAAAAEAPVVRNNDDGGIRRPELRIYSHSTFFYWWPVWLTGFIMAALTWVQGTHVQIGDVVEVFHPSKNLGVIYTAVFLLVILFTNVTVRGLASVVTILSVLLGTVLLAYFGLWDDILAWVPNLSVHMNLGFYAVFSSLIFLVWAFSTFVYDRMSYWTIRPGQIVQEFVIGGAERSYDTHGMVFDKLHEDFFRQWFLGFGAGDIKIMTTGARREEIFVPNVLFVDRKVDQIQKLISTRPDEFSGAGAAA